MSSGERVPYGSWPSPISARMVAETAVSLAGLQIDGSDVYWLEGRPTEGGRLVLVRRSASGEAEDVTPAEFSVRTLAHEYGGGAFLVADGTVFLSNFADQRLYRQDRDRSPVPITAEPPQPRSHRYADAVLTPDGSTLICVRERHEDDGVINELVAVAADGSAEPRILVGGNDFYSFPRVSPDGTKLAWTTWNHPNMPWDGTELWVADLTADGPANATLVAGGPEESIFQPAWSPGGVLHFVSDRTGWWNLYRTDGSGVTPLLPIEAEFGGPQWFFGSRYYAFLADGRIVSVFVEEGLQHLAVIEAPGRMRVVDLRFTTLAGPDVAPTGAVWLVASGSTEPWSVIAVDLDSGAVDVVKRASEVDVDPGLLSVAQPIDFPTAGGQRAHALFYPPANPDHGGPEDERPPLVVMSHGGPTGRTVSALNLEIQYFTSRGIAVVDVNYRGSTGYGRAYRDALKGQWGIVDVEDCAAAAAHLVETGEADPNRLAIRGGSAGGFTTLATLVFRDDFHAGASYYGVSDLGGLARETHKFESRYMDSMVGPYPEAEELYRERSPLEHVDRISTGVILFQGLEDEVVPPSQSELVADALKRNGLPYAYLAFEGEQHGFRRAETIERALEAELSFYGQVLGFEPHIDGPPVVIENLPVG
ncbi:MAG TPA: S9 family peptidase [Actinomycetota bacterium]|nr:S9 family peptidase [Actinomycetota bacterium]